MAVYGTKIGAIAPASKTPEIADLTATNSPIRETAPGRGSLIKQIELGRLPP